MTWKTDAPDVLEAVSYTRDFSAQSVFDELREDGGKSFSDTPEPITYYSNDNWKVYKVTVTIQPVD